MKFIRKIKSLLWDEERMIYIGRYFTFIMVGGVEVSGKIIEMNNDFFIIETSQGLCKLHRPKIMAEASFEEKKELNPKLVIQQNLGYNKIDGSEIPKPVVAKPNKKPMKTELQERLDMASKNAEELKEDLNIKESLEEEQSFSFEKERRSYGSIIPEDMLLPLEKKTIDKEDNDFSMGFGINFENKE